MQSRDGFTLIELLIVVVILGILASVAILRAEDARKEAYVTSMRSDVRNAYAAAIQYRATYGEYPASGVIGSDGSCGTSQAFCDMLNLSPGNRLGWGVDAGNPRISAGNDDLVITHTCDMWFGTYPGGSWNGATPGVVVCENTG